MAIHSNPKSTIYTSPKDGNTRIGESVETLYVQDQLVMDTNTGVTREKPNIRNQRSLSQFPYWDRRLETNTQQAIIVTQDTHVYQQSHMDGPQVFDITNSNAMYTENYINHQ